MEPMPNSPLAVGRAEALPTPIDEPPPVTGNDDVGMVDGAGEGRREQHTTPAVESTQAPTSSPRLAALLNTTSTEASDSDERATRLPTPPISDAAGPSKQLSLSEPSLKENSQTDAPPESTLTLEYSSPVESPKADYVDSFDDLAPLPTEFDPDAPFSPIQPTSRLPEDDELAIPKEDEAMEIDAPEELEAEEGRAEGGVDEGTPAGRTREATEEQGIREEALENAKEAGNGNADEEEDEQDRPDSSLLDILRGLKSNAEDDGEAEEEAMNEGSQRRPSPSPPGSPLTPVPELPTELPPDTEPLPPSSEQPWAESSAQAAARAGSGLGLSIVPKSEDGKRRRHAPDRYTPFRDDEVHSGSDTDSKPQKYKRKRGLDGKPIRSSKQPRKRLDAQLGIYRGQDKPPDKVAPRAKTLTDAKLKEMLRGKTREVQLAPCIRPRYGCWGKCTQCVSKIGGDQCRFRNYRVFPLNPETAEISGPGKFESTTLEGTMTSLPDRFNVELTEGHIMRTEQTVAPLLLSYITQELRHVVKNNAIHRPVDTAKHRAVCDFCASTVFGGFWFCKKCGRDFCLLCERYFSDSIETMRESPWPLPDAARPRLHHCTRGPDSELPIVNRPPRQRKFFHLRRDLQPTSRFTREELESNWLALVYYVLEPGDDFTIEERIASLGLEDGEEELSSAVRQWFTSQPAASPSSDEAMSEDDVRALYDASKEQPSVPDASGVTPLPYMFIDVDKLHNATFNQLWARGEPIVVDNVGKRLKEDWSPETFIERFGHEKCFIVDCISEMQELTTVGKFFQMFKAGEPLPPANEDKASLPAESSDAGKPSETQPLQTNTANDAAPVAEGSRPSTPPPAPSTAMNVDGPTVRGSTPGQANGALGGSAASMSALQQSNGHASTTQTQSNEEKPPQPAPDSHTPDQQSQTPQPEEDRATPLNRIRSSSTLSPVPSIHNSPAPSSPRKPDMSPFRDGKKRIWKLKDWPMTDDFQSAYPALYIDFSAALPVPDYTRRNGVLNLYSHFPPGPTRPDIGPKMYNAFASDEDKGSQGTTRLHMDVADAINIMLYASRREDGTPGCAVWDLFRAEDADKIRLFLKNKFPREVYTDPIHSQKFYLDTQLRKELFAKHGVASFRVYQYPGQAVFIPAGCAHQVCNLANCIKIALDFVSPHNVRRCQQLSQDFRKENFVRAWKDDVLQLYNVMWYAWTNVREKREHRRRKIAQDQAAHQQRQDRLAKLANGHTAFPSQTYPPPLGFLSPATSSVRDDPARPVASPTARSQSPSAAPSPAEGTAASAGQAPSEKDKVDESASGTPGEASAEPSKTAEADTANKDDEDSKDESEDKDKEAKASIARRLMDAALAREPQPIVIEPGTVTGQHAQQQQRRKDSFTLKQMEATPEPRLGESVRNGTMSADLALHVALGEMGNGGM